MKNEIVTIVNTENEGKEMCCSKGKYRKISFSKENDNRVSQKRKKKRPIIRILRIGCNKLYPFRVSNKQIKKTE